MKNKVWTERHVYFDMNTKAVISPNETQDGVILTVATTVGAKDEFKVYLSHREAKELAEQINSFVEDCA